MSWFAIYALFGMPMIALAIGTGVYFATGHSHRLHPGE